MSGPAISFDVSWWWDWVPMTRHTGETDRAAWTAALTEQLGVWTGAQVAAARAAWPAEATGEFPIDVGEMGTSVAQALLERAEALPGDCRLAWGAGFINDELRWLPVVVLARFQPAPADSDYLLAAIGADGLEGDVRDPHLQYVTTGHGDGVRVFALARSEAHGLHGRVAAALRLEGDTDPVDVLLTSTVTDLEQMSVIGDGVEMLMHRIAAQYAAEPDGDLPALRFVPATRPDAS